MERINNSPDTSDIRKHLSIDGMPAEAYDAISNGSKKIGLGILIQLLAAGAISQEIYAKWKEKLVVADGDGNITPVLNEDGQITIGTSIPNANINEALFTKNQYVGTAEGGNVTFRNNKTLQEMESVSAPSALLIAKDIESGMTAISEQDTQSPYPWQILLISPDESQQILTLNASTINALEFSNTKLYAAIKDKTDSKYYIKVFAPNGDKQYAEDTGSKIELPGNIYGRMEIHSGKIVTIRDGSLYIYDQNTSQQEKMIPEIADTIIGGKPDTNTMFLFNPIDGLLSIELTSPYKTTSLASVNEMASLLDGDSDYVPGSAEFSPDGNRLYFTTKSYGGLNKEAHYFVSVTLNPDGTVQKMEKSVLTQGSPAPAINDLAMDVDTDGDLNTNSLDNCPNVPNPEQLDSNNNGIGNACENPADFAAQQGYENHQELVGASHNVYTNGPVDIVDMEDKIVISPTQGQETKIEIINNGKEQTKQVFVNIPPQTAYTWASLEGFGDISETPNTDFPQNETPYESQTEENGVLVGISGTDIVITTKPATTVAEELQADEQQPETAEGVLEELTGETVDENIAEETKQDITEQADETTIPDEITQEADQAAEEASAEETTQAEEVQTDVIEPQKDTTTDAAMPDQGYETTAEIISEPEKPGNGGGGCSINATINGLESGTLMLATLGVLGSKYLKNLVYNARKKIRNVINS